MFMLWLYRYMTGYVVFVGNGRFAERFLNLCAKDNITIWNSYFSQRILHGCMSVHDYRHIRKVARSAGVTLRIKRRCGLRFVVEKHKTRLGIPVGIAAFFLIIWAMSSFVWQIDIVGTKTVNPESILAELETIGVREGVRKVDIDTEYMRQKLLIKDSRLSWAAINIDGCFVIIDVREVKKKKQNNLDNSPSNIIAKTGGKIISVKAYGGYVSVKSGEAVASGDLLVSGTIDLKNGATKFVDSNAVVMAQTQHVIKTYVPYEQVRQDISKYPLSRHVLTVFGINIPLFTGSVDYKYRAEKNYYAPIINEIEVPISVTKKDFYELEETTYIISDKTARELAIKKQDEQCKRRLKGIVKKRTKTVYISGVKGVTCICSYLCEEDIADKERILIEN